MDNIETTIRHFSHDFTRYIKCGDHEQAKKSYIGLMSYLPTLYHRNLSYDKRHVALVVDIWKDYKNE